jgi:hypothetical protein
MPKGKRRRTKPAKTKPGPWPAAVLNLTEAEIDALAKQRLLISRKGIPGLEYVGALRSARGRPESSKPVGPFFPLNWIILYDLACLKARARCRANNLDRRYREVLLPQFLAEWKLSADVPNPITLHRYRTLVGGKDYRQFFANVVLGSPAKKSKNPD